MGIQYPLELHIIIRHTCIYLKAGHTIKAFGAFLYQLTSETRSKFKLLTTLNLVMYGKIRKINWLVMIRKENLKERWPSCSYKTEFDNLLFNDNSLIFCQKFCAHKWEPIIIQGIVSKFQIFLLNNGLHFGIFQMHC